MKNTFLEKVLRRVSQIGASPSDNDELKLRKSLLVICSFLFIFAGFCWGMMYFFFGEKQASIIPLSYCSFSVISIIYFGSTCKFRIFLFSQLLLILVLPFALMFALGGFVNGSVVIFWSLICPLGALLFDKQSNALYWLISYTLLVVFSLILEPMPGIQSHLSGIQINFFFAINLVAVGVLIFVMVSYFVGKKNFFQAQSETLLLNILPREIATELKTSGGAVAKYFDMVTVLFTDFKDFTLIAEKLTPVELVAEIDTCFKAFDRIVAKFNIEKIKTIGDSYMCAGGLPVPNSTHPVDVVNAAIEIRQFMIEYALLRSRLGKIPFQVRIGIHTGPVVAGIVGVTKFAYDIWGDTVNIASRMEAAGEAGKINISGTTYAQVKDKFHCIHRGKIQAKNKGDIDMYFVEAPIE